MGHDRMRPFICVGIAYLIVAVAAPLMILGPNASAGWTFAGVSWSLVAGAAGAVGALGILLALNAGGIPSYVMPLVFGLAPAVNAFVTIGMANKWQQISPFFLAGLVVTALGAVMVLFFAPRPTPPAKGGHAAVAPASTSPAPNLHPSAENPFTPPTNN